MITFAFGVEAWPRSLEVQDVERHKSTLIQQARYALLTKQPTVARTVSRGALYWERWLLEKDPGHSEEERVLSGLELAGDAGDWKEAELMLAHCESSVALKDRTFVEKWRETVRVHLPEQVENEQRLEIAFQKLKGKKVEDEFARDVMARAAEIGAVGSPVPVNYISARISASQGWSDEAEAYYAALLVCRPLWIPYIVQLSEHQAKTDLKRAFNTIEAAKLLLGKDFWLAT
ncbi:hypothetical protein [Polyangium aurulentum]|uniref:hypothetical protein n=1 Tax=Polyangium aurulentum TaxID=2567896 RepID=UPI0010AE343C|nr:hypothetical protein [Polyangium aurulentum]UQA61947.1 hypothetical protein E8A73_016330 [Polyangium aurulentum]